jgi:hypothetical protein
VAAAGPWTVTSEGRTKILDGTLASGDTYKVALLTSASNIGAASTTFAGVTGEHAAANGYAAGGIAVTLALAGTVSVTVKTTADPVWTAAGGSITARWACLYEVGGRVLAYALLDGTPADVTATDGNTLTVGMSGSNTIMTLA